MYQKYAFIHNIRRLFSFTVIGQVLYGLTSLIVVKKLPIESYGYAQCLLTYASFCSLFVTLKYEVALFSPDVEEPEMNALIKISLLSATCLAFVMTLVLCGLKRWLLKGFSVTIEALLLAFFLILVTAVFYAIKSIYVKRGDFKKLGHYLMINNVLRATIPLILLLFLKNWKVIIYGEIISYSFSLMRARDIWFFPLTMQPPMSLKSLIVKHASYPKRLVLSTILDSVSFSLLVPGVNFFYGAQNAGCFAFFFRIIQMPISIIGRAVGDVCQNGIVNAAKYESSLGFLKRVTALISVFSVVIYTSLLIVGPGLLNYFLNAQWVVGKTIFYSLVVSSSIHFIVNPLSTTLLVRKDGISYKLIYDSLAFLLMVLLFSFTWVFHLSFMTYIRLLSFSLVLSFFVYYYLIYSFTKSFVLRDQSTENAS